MGEMVERVARAMAEATNGSKWDDGHYYTGGHKELWMKRARAAIEAMKVPTEAMLKAHGVQTNCPMCGGHTEGWELLIKEALK